MWLGQDCASYMLYVDGPNGAFAVLEIVDTLYDQNKVVKILSPLLDAKSHSSHFKGLWKINLRRDEYLGILYFTLLSKNYTSLNKCEFVNRVFVSVNGCLCRKILKLKSLAC